MAQSPDITDVSDALDFEDVRLKMRRDWDRRADADPLYWVAATQEADVASYHASAHRDVGQLLQHFEGRVELTSSHVLDLGCGIGRLSAPLAERCKAVTGVDVSPRMIDEARRLHARQPNLRFLTTTGADLRGLPDDSFDAVFSFSVLPHLPPDVVESYFMEVNRVLRTGGWFVYQFWVGDARPAAPNDSLTIRVYSEDQLDRLHSDGGMVIQEISKMDYFDPVLELNPVWIVSRKTRPADGGRLFDPMRPAEPSEAERTLESGLLVYLAMKQGERGEVQAAEAALSKAVEADPSRGEAYLRWAGHRLDAGDLQSAFDIFDRMVEALPEVPVGWLYRGEAALSLGRPALAQSCIDHLFSLADLPDDLKAHAERIQVRLSS